MVKESDRKLYLIIVLIAISTLIICTVVYYIYKLTTPFEEENVLLDSHHMTQEKKYTHEEVFEHDNCEMGVTYMFWCYIKSWSLNYDRLKPILNKGNKLKNNYSNDELMSLNTSMPAIYLNAETPTMIFVFGNEDSEGPYEITNIPLKKWFHIGVTIYDNMIELFMDGHLIKTAYFENSLPINYNMLRIGELGGFDGFISKLVVVPYVLASSVVQQYYLAGPEYIDMNSLCFQTNGTDGLNNNNNNNNNNGTGYDPDMNNDTWTNPNPISLDNITMSGSLNNGGIISRSISLNDDREKVVTIYSRPYFSGSSRKLAVGMYSKKDLADMGIEPESISSIKINEGYLVTLYKNDQPSETEGKSNMVILRNNSDWNGALKPMNNQANSIKIEEDPYIHNLKATFYEYRDYKGWEVTLALGKYTQTDLVKHGFSIDDLSSYKIEEGFQAILYEDDYFGGEFVLARGNNNNMGKLNNKVRSLKLEAYTDDVKPVCKFYRETLYGGDYVSLSYGEYNMYDLLKRGLEYVELDNSFKIKSVIIPKGFNVLIYQRDQFNGVAQRLEESTENLQNKLFYFSVIKSIKIIKVEEPRFSFENLLKSFVNAVSKALGLEYTEVINNSSTNSTNNKNNNKN